MLHHMWGVCSTYDTMRPGALVTFDYSNAVPSLTHQYIATVLGECHARSAHAVHTQCEVLNVGQYLGGTLVRRARAGHLL